MKPAHERRSALAEFLSSEAAGGIVLIIAAVVAIGLANSPAAGTYFGLLSAHVGPLTVQHWINDGLMTLFFLLVGLEIKREWVSGHLSSWRSRALPAVAAAAGMAAPALVFLLVIGGAPGLVRGWAIPAATDIAFSLGVLALLGPRVPASLKLFLVAVAIVDDMGAVAIIAIAYTDRIETLALIAAAAILLLMALLGRLRVRSLWPFLLLMPPLWLATYLSGVHPTIAGVLAAFTIPLGGVGERSPLHRLEHALQSSVAFGIVPLFGLANAGVALHAGGGGLLAPLPLGIAAGLFLGKQAGIMAGVALATATRLARPPQGASIAALYGVALLCGIGFTMSLFIGGLAFPNTGLESEVKLGVLAGSLVSAVAGYAVLRLSLRHQSPPHR